MRALPADSLEYFDETAVGKTAFPTGPGVCFAAVVGCDEVAAGEVAVGEAAACGVVDPHSAFRKSFHFIPFRVPACCAALYLALHSFAVSACAEGIPPQAIAAIKAMAQPKAERIIGNTPLLTLN
jgi:hypothetical protein